MTAPASIFARHIDTPTRRHRCILLDPTHLRCLDCDHTLVLPSGLTTTSTSSTDHSNLNDPNACPEHNGHWAATCGPCRSERIAIPDGQTKPKTGPDPTDPTTVDEWVAARNRFTHNRQRALPLMETTP